MKFRGDYANILLAGCIYTKKKVLHITIITVGTKYRVPHLIVSLIYKENTNARMRNTRTTQKQAARSDLSLSTKFNILCYDQIYTYVPTNTVQFARTRDKFDS